jgi:hypothetical protein
MAAKIRSQGEIKHQREVMKVFKARVGEVKI